MTGEERIFSGRPDRIFDRIGVELEERSIVFEPTDIARAGVFVSIDSEGRLSVDRGYVRPEDEAPREDTEVGQGVDMSSSEGQESGRSGVQRTAISIAGSAADTEDDDEDAARSLPDRLITELTAHRTLALRDALAESPAITFQAVLHNFVLTAFYRFATSGSCLEIGTSYPDVSHSSSWVKGMRVRESCRGAA
jgi:ParB family chromosome partitioning protein